jgi:hypothetical protein
MPSIVNKGMLNVQTARRWKIHEMKCLVFCVY